MHKSAMSLALFCISAQATLSSCNLGLQFGTHYQLLAACALISSSTEIKRWLILVLNVMLMSLYFCLVITFRDCTVRFVLPDYLLNILMHTNLIIAFGGIAVSLYRYRMALSTAEQRLVASHGKILRMANTDALTGIANRRHIQEILRGAIYETRASSCSLAVSMADIDNFKAINDRYGHECGDAVLVEISRLFQQVIRKTDSFGRWGGEEFLFVLKKTNLQEARETMERLRLAISSSGFTWNGEKIPLTVTVGVTIYQPGVSPEKLVGEADNLLYEGKNSGKNRVVTGADTTGCE